MKMIKNNKVNLALGVGTVVLTGVLVAADYKTSKWKCRYCEEEFKASFSEYFFAGHTPTRRKLMCPVCGNKGYFKCIREIKYRCNNEKL